MTDASPSRRTVLGRGLAILVAWHVVLAGLLVLLLYLAYVDNDDCVAYGCLLRGQPGLVLWLAAVLAGIPLLFSLLVSAATCAVLVLGSGYRPVPAAVAGAFAGLLAACFAGLLWFALTY